MTIQPSYYDSLTNTFSYVQTLFHIRELMKFDFAAHMPPQAIGPHMKAVAVLNGHLYSAMTDQTLPMRIEKALKGAQRDHPENKWLESNILQMRRLHKHHASVPRDIYRKHVETKMIYSRRFSEAKNCKSWDEVLPYISQTFDLYREVAEQKQRAMGLDTPYSALITSYASGMDEAGIEQLFDSLIPEIRKIKAEVPSKTQDRQSYSRPDRSATLHAAKNILGSMGFDYGRGDLYVTRSSPLAAGFRDDMRVLVRCSEESAFDDTLTDVLYQGARAVYEQNLPEDWTNQPIGQVSDIVLVNAITLLFETIIGRSRAFVHYIARPQAGWEPADEMFERRNAVKASVSRNGADEIHKIFHDYMRFRIERDLFNGVLDLKDVPKRWNEESESLLGLTPETLQDGPLQNPDWFSGRYGFIGSSPFSHMLAAQLFSGIERDNPEVLEEIARGQLGMVSRWLAYRVFSRGRSASWQEIAQEASDYNPAVVEPFLNHLRRRYVEGSY